MSLTTGARVGPYEVMGTLGAGGMGEVYRARDTRLDRDVALKILPEAFAADPERHARFEREARTLASLNHPNIAAIYGVEERALVMELVLGEDLAALVARGAMPVKDALAVAKQIADALEAAHEAGVIHRDLKPANILVRVDGTVKVLDFGLAKALDPNPADSPSGSMAGSRIATLAHPAMTAHGLILGTAAYMSPEQAKGRPVDRRADVWAFGVVLYEMLTGRSLFGREDVPDTLAAVLTNEPDLRLLPPSTPVRVRQLLVRCLAKDKRQRLDSMAAARLDIEEAERAPLATTLPGGRSRALQLAAGLAAAAFAVGWFASALFASGTAGAGQSPAIVADIAAPADAISAFHDGFALSPDGQVLVFAARNSSGIRQLWRRPLDSATAQPIAGTEGAVHPFWSPTGKHVAFFAGTKLRRVPLGGGDPQTICDVFGLFPAGSWGANDEILFASLLAGDRSRVYRVAAAGGTPAAIESLGVAVRPTWLGDGRRFVYAGRPDKEWGVHLADVGGGVAKLLAPLPDSDWPFAYDPAGYLLLNRNDVLTAQRVNAEAGALTGPVATISGVAGTPKAWMAVSSAADRLVGLVARSGEGQNAGDPLARLQWVTREGAAAGSMGDIGRYWTLALSPDGRRAGVNEGNAIWVVDAANRKVRATSSSLGADDFPPVWSPDGSAIVFRSREGVSRQSLDHEAPPALVPGAVGLPRDWSRDGRWLLMGVESGSANQADIWLYDLQAQTQAVWLATEFKEEFPRFSPDGRWVAYASNASGRDEVYVRPIDGAGKAIAVSSNGGTHPRWRRDGRELYFLGPADEMMAVGLTASGGSLVPAAPQRLFTVPLNDISRGSFAPYDVTADGQRFLLNVPDRPAPLYFLQGLSALVKD